MVKRRNKTGFTLIELLVVITIIVVLLALLVPAMDKAIYQAELAVCGTRMRAVATGAQTYAFDNKRKYPVNPMERAMELIKANPVRDLRPALRPYMPLLSLLDPLAGEYDMERDYSLYAGHYQVFIPRALWFGWSYEGHGEGMTRLGGRVSHAGNKYNILVSDLDIIDKSNHILYNAHPDHHGVMNLDTHEDAGSGADFGGAGAGAVETATWWTARGRFDRGPTDMNYAYGDGSVRRFNDVKVDDDRMGAVPENFAADVNLPVESEPTNRFWQLPKN